MASHSFQCEAGLEQQLCWPPPTNQDGKALQWVGEEMKCDRELCMAAVTQDGRALEWAGQKMKRDRELCMAAVAQH